MHRIVHFEINADDPKRAVKFYEKVFGWKIETWGGPMNYWLVTTGTEKEPGINGAIMKRMKKGCTTIIVGVPSVDEFLKKLVAAGGKALTKKEPISGIGYSAYCLDSEGNLFGIFQDDKTAK